MEVKAQDVWFKVCSGWLSFTSCVAELCTAWEVVGRVSHLLTCFKQFLFLGYVERGHFTQPRAEAACCFVSLTVSFGAMTWRALVPDRVTLCLLFLACLASFYFRRIVVMEYIFSVTGSSARVVRDAISQRFWPEVGATTGQVQFSDFGATHGSNAQHLGKG